MAQSKPLFRFVHATDLHYEISQPPQEPLVNQRIECLIQDINALHAETPIEFVLFSGDLTNRGAACQRELKEAKSCFDALNMPYHVIAGNHDLAPHRKFAAMYPGKEDYDEGAAGESFFARVFGPQGLRFSFEKEGYHFVGVSLRDEDPDGMLDYLESTLAGFSGKAILMTHYGLYPPRDAGRLQSWGFARIASILPRLRTMLDNSGTKVVMYLYGHNHINSVVQRNGTYHVSGGGIQRGCTGFRLFSCYQERIEASYRYLSKPSLHDFNYWGLTNPENCIDATHDNAEIYHRGNDDEQSFTIHMTAPA